jgi:hypothetical protein
LIDATWQKKFDIKRQPSLSIQTRHKLMLTSVQTRATWLLSSIPDLNGPGLILKVCFWVFTFYLRVKLRYQRLFLDIYLMKPDCNTKMFHNLQHLDLLHTLSISKTPRSILFQYICFLYFRSQIYEDKTLKTQNGSVLIGCAHAH